MICSAIHAFMYSLIPIILLPEEKNMRRQGYHHTEEMPGIAAICFRLVTYLPRSIFRINSDYA